VSNLASQEGLCSMELVTLQ